MRDDNILQPFPVVNIFLDRDQSIQAGCVNQGRRYFAALSRGAKLYWQPCNECNIIPKRIKNKQKLVSC